MEDIANLTGIKPIELVTTLVDICTSDMEKQLVNGQSTDMTTHGPQSIDSHARIGPPPQSGLHGKRYSADATPTQASANSTPPLANGTGRK
jgi:hypothetical protein